MLVKISLLCPNTPPAQLKTPTSPPGAVCIAVPLRTFKKLIICRAHTPGSEIIILTGHTGTHATHHSLDLLMLAVMKRKLVWSELVWWVPLWTSDRQQQQQAHLAQLWQGSGNRSEHQRQDSQPHRH